MSEEIISPAFGHIIKSISKKTGAERFKYILHSHYGAQCTDFSHNAYERRVSGGS